MTSLDEEGSLCKVGGVAYTEGSAGGQGEVFVLDEVGGRVVRRVLSQDGTPVGERSIEGIRRSKWRLYGGPEWRRKCRMYQA